jgi:alpha-1,3-rhamnosyltransferase
VPDHSCSLAEPAKISVVIPCYNHEQFVTRAIESVMAQSYPNLELIVVDDGSTDHSVAVIKELAKRHHFKFVSQENFGLSKTLNFAITKLSTGEFISLLASDDYYHPDKISKQFEELSGNPDCEYCASKSAEIDSVSGRAIRVFPRKKVEGDVKNRIFMRQPYAAGSVLFTRKLYEQAGGFDETLKYEDWDFSIRCSALTKFCYVDEVLFYYWSHETNTSKVMDRRSIFQQKARTLAKNYHLVSPWVWLKATIFHFVFDHILFRLRWFHNIKRFL